MSERIAPLVKPGHHGTTFGGNPDRVPPRPRDALGDRGRRPPRGDPRDRRVVREEAPKREEAQQGRDRGRPRPRPHVGRRARPGCRRGPEGASGRGASSSGRPGRRCCASCPRTSSPARPCPDSSRRSRRSSASRRRRKSREAEGQESRARLFGRARHVRSSSPGSRRTTAARSSPSPSTSARPRRPPASRRRRRRPAPPSSSSSTRRTSSRRTTCSRSCKAGAVYEHDYLLGTATARPLIAKKQVEVALATGCDALRARLHGEGQRPGPVRARVHGARAGARDHRAVARVGDRARARTRSTTRRRAASPSPATKKDSYSRDRNLWHLSHEGGPLEEPGFEPEPSMFKLTVDPEKAPDAPERVTIAFEAGLPVAVNGEKLAPVPLIEKLNEIGGRHGVGRVDIVENRLIGIKSRGVYETPGGTLLVAGAPGARDAHARPRQRAREGEARRALRRARLLRAVVLAAPRSARRVHERAHADRDGRRHAQALQGLLVGRGPHVAARALLGAPRLVRHARLHARRRGRLHPPLRPAHEGAPAPEGRNDVPGRRRGERAEALARRQLWGGRFSEPPAAGAPGFQRLVRLRPGAPRGGRRAARSPGRRRSGRPASSRAAERQEARRRPRGDRRRGVADGRAFRRGRRGRAFLRRGAPRREGRARSRGSSTRAARGTTRSRPTSAST